VCFVGGNAEGARHVVDVHLRHESEVGTLSQKQLSSSTKNGKPITGGCITAAGKPRARNRIFRSENFTINGTFLLEIDLICVLRRP